jgi:hypothetical protein
MYRNIQFYYKLYNKFLRTHIRHVSAFGRVSETLRTKVMMDQKLQLGCELQLELSWCCLQ